MAEKPVLPESIPTPVDLEKSPSLEQVSEDVSERKDSPKPVENLASPLPQSMTAKSALPQSVSQKSETLEKIEDIMEEDLESVYQELPEEAKKVFREKGEETAVEIESMLHRVKLKSKDVFKLLFGWMKVIPSVNKYFLKQEAKIKTDEIMHVKEELDKASSGHIET